MENFDLLFSDVSSKSSRSRDNSEAYFKYLEQSSRPEFAYIREFLQEWFNNYETSKIKRGQLLRNFQSDDDREHLSALTELYVYTLFRKLGFKIEVEPERENGTKPDFLVSKNDTQILVEVTGCYSDKNFGSLKKKQDELLDAINNVKSPYWIDITIIHRSKNDLSTRQLKRYIGEFTKTLNIDELRNKQVLAQELCSPHDRPYTEWTYAGWKIGLWFSPKPEGYANEQNNIGITSHGWTIVEVVDDIQRKIKTKYNKYNEKNNKLDIPYLLFISVYDDFFNENEHIPLTFFGNFDLHSQHNKQPIRIPKHHKSGSLVDPETDTYYKKRLSAVCVIKNLDAWRVNEKNPTVWHHPQPNYPLNSNILPIDQRIPDLQNNVYNFQEGRPINEILELDLDRLNES